MGKTPQEVLNLATQMADVLAAPQAPRTPPAPAPGAPTADEWTLDPQQAAQKHLEYNYQTRFAPVLQSMQQQLAGTSRGLANQQFNTEFQRWGPEIDQMVANVPAEQRTFELYSQAVKLVKANHIEDIVAERAQAKMAELGIERTSTGGNSIAPAGVATVSLDKLDPGYKAAIERMGIGPSELNEFLAKTHQTMEQFVEAANRRQVITDVSFDHKGRSQVAVGDLGALYGKTVGVDGKPIAIKEW